MAHYHALRRGCMAALALGLCAVCACAVGVFVVAALAKARVTVPTAKTDQRGSRYRAFRVAPAPFGGCANTTSPARIA
jgi:hypothetical protein